MGITTTTGDCEGDIVDRKSFQPFTEQQLTAALNHFFGESSQIPSMYSALKHQGQPLYKLARQGIEVERKPRPITVHAIDLISHTAEDFTFKVLCSKGTYVRTLVEDIGKLLGCGGHVAELRRLQVGPYSEEKMLTLEQLEALASESLSRIDELLLGVDSSVVDWPKLTLTESSAFALANGQAIRVGQRPAEEGLIALYDARQQFIGVGEILDDGRIAPKRLIKQ